MNVIQKLKTRMKIEGLRQIDIANVLGTNKYTVHRWLSGKTDPSPVYIRLIEKYLEI